MNVEVSPAASEEETAAILAAIELFWPQPPAGPTTSAPIRSAWRFSGRWWSRPVPVRRDRPWF